MSMQRRTFLKSGLAGSAVAVAVGAGLLTPQAVLASWPKGAFEADSMDAVMQNLYQDAGTQDSSDIQITAPDIAENGAVVPVTINTSIANPESITIIVEKNNQPLAGKFDLSANAEGMVATRIKMARTSDVVAVVQSNGKLHTARREVKVTIGGCGG
ncbi:thiosulfate oxidation carrier protein SoxY [Ectothiorhodospiraceae bacterium 2226]|nr:thiosulfate oxidation carrier protein SoxY [Ectothiorhodospiraceae bacterium 2226]